MLELPCVFKKLGVDHMIDDASLLQKARVGARTAEDVRRALAVQMVTILEPESSKMSKVGRLALEASVNYWRHGVGTTRSLEDHRVAMWNFMQEKNGDSTTISDDEDRLLRAILATLRTTPVKDDPFGEHDIEWFALMLNQIETNDN